MPWNENTLRAIEPISALNALIGEAREQLDARLPDAQHAEMEANLAQLLAEKRRRETA